MATRDDIDIVKDMFAAARAAARNRVDSPHASVVKVLTLLCSTDVHLKPQFIYQKLGIGPTWGASLMRRIAEHGLIIRHVQPRTQNLIWVELTPRGRDIAMQILQQRDAQFARIIDELGMDRIHEYFEVSQKINDIMCPIHIDL